jgi:hypothetical protein
MAQHVGPDVAQLCTLAGLPNDVGDALARELFPKCSFGKDEKRDFFYPIASG